MKKLNLIACCSCSILFGTSVLACDYPKSPPVPNGSTASKEEMLAGQKEVKGYINKLEAYQDCLVAEEEAARATLDNPQPEELQRREQLLNEKYNAAHDEMLKAAAAFNAELKEFQSREEK